MTTLTRVSNLNYACIDMDLSPETDTLLEKCKGINLQESNQIKMLDELLITFPTTARSIPFSLIERVLVHYRPARLTLACNRMDGSIRSFTVDLTEKGLSFTTYSESERMKNTCTEEFTLPAALSETKELRH